MSLPELLQGRAAELGDKPFLFFRDEVVGFAEMDSRANQWAHALEGLGVSQGQAVAIMLPNLPQFLYCWFGLAKLSAVMVPLNPAFQPAEAAYIVEHSQAVGVVTDAARLAMMRGALAGQRPAPWLALAGGDDGAAGAPSLDRLARAMPDLPPARRPSGRDIAQIIYTSGTTGFPKGVLHCQDDFVLAGQAFTLCAGLGADDRLLVALPLFHANAQYYSVMGALAAGAGLILLPRFSASRFWEQAARHQATEFNFVGALGQMLCARPPEEFRPGHVIKTAYGALVTPQVYETFRRRFHIPNVIDGYGLSEAPRVCQNPIGGLAKPGSMGLPARHPDPAVDFCQVRIVDDQDRDLPAGQTGELVLQSAVLMRGYHRDPLATAQALRGGWFHTGDLAWRDQDGYLFFVARRKEIIRRRGENISPAEIEAVICAHPGVTEAAVVAVPAELGEDDILACVVAAPDGGPGPGEIVEWCRPRLAGFKLPRYVLMRDSLPKTATARVAKHLLLKEPDLLARAVDLGPRGRPGRSR